MTKNNIIPSRMARRAERQRYVAHVREQATAIRWALQPTAEQNQRRVIPERRTEPVPAGYLMGCGTCIRSNYRGLPRIRAATVAGHANPNVLAAAEATTGPGTDLVFCFDVDANTWRHQACAPFTPGAYHRRSYDDWYGRRHQGCCRPCSDKSKPCWTWGIWLPLPPPFNIRFTNDQHVLGPTGARLIQPREAGVPLLLHDRFRLRFMVLDTAVSSQECHWAKARVYFCLDTSAEFDWPIRTRQALRRLRRDRRSRLSWLPKEIVQIIVVLCSVS